MTKLSDLITEYAADEYGDKAKLMKAWAAKARELESAPPASMPTERTFTESQVKAMLEQAADNLEKALALHDHIDGVRYVEYDDLIGVVEQLRSSDHTAHAALGGHLWPYAG